MSSETSPSGEPRRILIISPCRDEDEHLEINIQTMAEQTLKPTLWVIVDDGSTDRTPEILADAAKKYPFIKVITREDRGGRIVGPGVIDAFYEGLNSENLDDYDYVCKLDNDLEFPPRYFETVVEKLEADPLMGNYSGKTYVRLDDGRMVSERLGDENAIGPAKFYKVKCFQDVGGFVREVGWDGIDGHMCRLKGWIARSEDLEETRLIHRRRMGSSHIGLWHGRQRWGRCKYFMGSAPWFIFAVSLFRMMERPFIVSGLGIFVGYFSAMLRRTHRYDNPAFRKMLRRYEWLAMTRGKARALEIVDAEVRSRAKSSKRD